MSSERERTAVQETHHTGQHPSRLLVIRRHWVVEDPLARRLYDMMSEAYEPHRSSTPFRYHYTEAEWAEIMQNDQLVKIVAYLDGHVAGLVTGAEVADVDWISDEFWQERHPGRRVVYLQDLFVDPAHQNLRVVRALLQDGIDYLLERDAIVAFDMSDMLVKFGFPELIQEIVTAQLGATVRRVDVHHYFEFDSREGSRRATPNLTMAEGS